jgi:hypothetical protein
MKRLPFVLGVSLAMILSACGGGGGSSGTNVLSASSAATDSTGGTTATTTVSAGVAASIALAAGDKIDASDEIFYAKRFAVTVADTNGVPVVGAKISLNVTYPGFYKGSFNRAADFKVVSITRFFCAGEDVNNNDVLDSGEDTNGNGKLEPAKALVTAAIEGSDLTDTNGNVKILVRWPKAHASWVEYRLNTKVSFVVGTEGTSGFDLRTSYAVGDDELASTPFVRSPFGVSAGCDNTN